MTTEQKSCLACERRSAEVPLIAFEYRGRTMWICAQHLPLLIHDPRSLADKLPGAEGLDGAGS